MSVGGVGGLDADDSGFRSSMDGRATYNMSFKAMVQFPFSEIEGLLNSNDVSRFREFRVSGNGVEA